MPYTCGIITTVAGDGTRTFGDDGDPVIVAQLHGPTGLAIDATGTAFITYTFNDRVRIFRLDRPDHPGSQDIPDSP